MRRSPLLADVRRALTSRAQAAATTCYAAVHPRLAGVSGRYLADCNEALPSPAAASRREAARLWQASEDMISGYSSQQGSTKERNI